MQDDVTRGAHAPIEADGAAWQREPDVDRRPDRGRTDEVRVGLTAVVLSVRPRSGRLSTSGSRCHAAPSASIGA
jgi:hypothetical protein